MRENVSPSRLQEVDDNVCSMCRCAVMMKPEILPCPKTLVAPVDILPQIAHGLKVDFLVGPSSSRNEFTVHNTL